MAQSVSFQQDGSVRVGLPFPSEDPVEAARQLEEALRPVNDERKIMPETRLVPETEPPARPLPPRPRGQLPRPAPLYVPTVNGRRDQHAVRCVQMYMLQRNNENGVLNNYNLAYAIRRVLVRDLPPTYAGLSVAQFRGGFETPLHEEHDDLTAMRSLLIAAMSGVSVGPRHFAHHDGDGALRRTISSFLPQGVEFAYGPHVFVLRRSREGELSATYAGPLRPETLRHHLVEIPGGALVAPPAPPNEMPRAYLEYMNAMHMQHIVPIERPEPLGLLVAFAPHGTPDDVLLQGVVMNYDVPRNYTDPRYDPLRVEF